MAVIFVLCDRGLRGKPLSERAQEVSFRIGLAIVLLLLVYTTYQDRLIPLKWIGIG
jgi:membrane-associated protease RseP (regulator of RpoE activity)